MIAIVLGTRSEVIKLSSIIRELKKRNIPFKIINTGEHDTSKFIKTLKLPEPDYYLGKSLREKWAKKSRIHASLLALNWGIGIFFKLRKIFKKEKPNIILYNANCMTIPLIVIAAKSLFFKKILVHRESGLRWGGLALADLYRKFGEFGDILFAPTRNAEKRLRKMYKNKTIVFSGDPQVEIIKQTLKLHPSKNKEKNYMLVNIVRSLNTEKKANDFVEILLRSPFKTICIINPSARNTLERLNLLKKIKKPNIRITNPVVYPTFLKLMRNASVVITDSHGVEEECTILKIPCIVLNDFIQSPELEKYGPIVRTGIDKRRIIELLEDVKNKGEFYNKAKKCKYSLGDGKATERIVDVLEEQLKNI